MKNHLKKFSFPYKTGILIFSALMIFIPFTVLGSFSHKMLVETKPIYLKLLLLLPTLIAALGFIYCTLGYHFQILRGDELKLRIHLEALNIAFTTALVFLFAFIFIFLNFNPTQLNYLLVYLSIIGIIAYVVGVEIVKRKYR